MSFTLKYQGQEKSFEKKVALRDLVDDPKKEFVCAKVNNRIRECYDRAVGECPSKRALRRLTFGKRESGYRVVA